MPWNEQQHGGGEQTIQILDEQVTVQKQVVDTAQVRISTHVSERTETVHETIQHEDVIVDRIFINRVVDSTPEPRQEGDAFIFPIVEEEVVVTKRLILKEEVRISRKTRIEPIKRDVVVRTMNATVERTDAPSLPQQTATPQQES